MNVDEKPNEKGHSNVITKETNKEPQENAMINNKSTKIASSFEVEQPPVVPSSIYSKFKEEPEDNNEEEQQETRINTNYINENTIKIIDDFYKDNDAEKFFKRIKYLTIMLPESKFEEIAEEEAEKLSQMNFNGVKLFNDIAEARQFLHDLRYGRRNRFKGQNQKFYKLPKIQKIIKQSEQTKQIISPMMIRNIKPLTKTNYIYEY